MKNITKTVFLLFHENRKTNFLYQHFIKKVEQENSYLKGFATDSVQFFDVLENVRYSEI